MSQEAGGKPATPPANDDPDAVVAPAHGPILRQLRLGLATALGIRRVAPAAAEPLDASTRMAKERTDLAVERSYLAADRTLMAWIRTALSMISFGFTIGKLGQAFESVEIEGLLRGQRMLGVESIAYFLVVLGTFALAGALLQYLRSLGAYAEMGLRSRFSISLAVGLVLVVVGGVALTALVARL